MKGLVADEIFERGTVFCPTRRVVNWSNGICPTLYFRGLENVRTFFPRVGKCSKVFDE